MLCDRDTAETMEEYVAMKLMRKQNSHMSNQKSKEEEKEVVEEGESEGRDYTLTEEKIQEILGPVDDTE